MISKVITLKPPKGSFNLHASSREHVTRPSKMWVPKVRLSQGS